MSNYQNLTPYDTSRDEENAIEDFLIDDDDREDLNDHDFLADHSANHYTPSPAPNPEVPFTTANDTVTIGGERIETRRFTGGDTLDEPVLKTIMRDVKGVGRRVREIIWPFRRGQTFDFRSIEEGLSRGFNNEGVEGEMAGVKDWDLWGPLVFCLAISLLLSWSAPQAKDKNSQTSNSKNVMFSGVFVLIWLGLMVLTVNIKLLGGSISFFRALCVIGYGLFPLVISALLSLVLRHKLLVVKIVVNAIVVSWSVFAVRNALLHSGVWGSRSFLALFPVGLFFITLGWLCVIS